MNVGVYTLWKATLIHPCIKFDCALTPAISIFLLLILFCVYVSFQNLLISDQSSVIIKSLSKLPKFFDIVVYPTLLTIVCDNDGAKNVIGKEFDIKVIFLLHILIGFVDGVHFILSIRVWWIVIDKIVVFFFFISSFYSASMITRSRMQARKIKCSRCCIQIRRRIKSRINKTYEFHLSHVNVSPVLLIIYIRTIRSQKHNQFNFIRKKIIIANKRQLFSIRKRLHDIILCVNSYQKHSNHIY